MPTPPRPDHRARPRQHRPARVAAATCVLVLAASAATSATTAATTATTTAATTTAATAATATADDWPLGLEAVPPLRYWDPRGDPEQGGKAMADTRFAVQVGGVPVFGPDAEPIPADAEALFVNVTVDDPEGPGYVSVLPGSDAALHSQVAPATSNLNVDAPGQAIANTAIIPTGEMTSVVTGEQTPGWIVVYTSLATYLLVDVMGYVPAGADYTSIPLTRALDTRPTGGAVADQRIDVDVIGDFGPADAVLAIVNLTLVDAGAPGFVTAWSAGTGQPDTSNLNVDAAGQTRAGMAIVPVGAGGELSLVTSTDGELLVDVLGYFGPHSQFVGLDPFDRVLDTRPHRVAADSTANVVVTDAPGVPDTARYALVNVTAVEASAAGFVTVWSGDHDQPYASNLNYGAGGTIANTVLVPLGADGSVDIYTQSEIDLLVDVIGYL